MYTKNYKYLWYHGFFGRFGKTPHIYVKVQIGFRVVRKFNLFSICINHLFI